MSYPHQPGSPYFDGADAFEAYLEAPEHWAVCVACDGNGFIPRRVTVYEYGCSFPRSDTHEEICSECNGNGGWPEDCLGHEGPR